MELLHELQELPYTVPSVEEALRRVRKHVFAIGRVGNGKSTVLNHLAIGGDLPEQWEAPFDTGAKPYAISKDVFSLPVDLDRVEERSAGEEKADAQQVGHGIAPTLCTSFAQSVCVNGHMRKVCVNGHMRRPL